MPFCLVAAAARRTMPGRCIPKGKPVRFDETNLRGKSNHEEHHSSGGRVFCVLPCVARAQSARGKVRTYCVAADEVNWDYAPSGRDEVIGHSFGEVEKPYVEPGPHRIGRVYKKGDLP